MSEIERQRELFALHAEICKTFSNPIRLEILHLLRNGEATVTQLVKKTDYSQANISQHLSIMRNKGIVQTRRRGKNVYYRLSSPKITQAFDIIRQLLTDRLEKDKKTTQVKP